MTDAVTPERAREIFIAVSLHFRTDYDFFKYGGKLRRPLKDDQRDVHRMNAMIRKTGGSEAAVIQCIVANVLERKKISGRFPMYVGDIWNPDTIVVWRRWQERIGRMGEVAEVELKKVGLSFSKCFGITGNAVHPPIYEEYIRGVVSMETMCCVVGAIPGITDYWAAATSDPILFPEDVRFFRKYSPFLPIDGKIKGRIAAVKAALDDDKMTRKIGA